MSKEKTAIFVAMIQKKYKRFTHRLFRSHATTTTTTNESVSQTSRNDSSVGSSDSSSDKSHIFVQDSVSNNTAIKVATTSETDKILEIVKANFAEFNAGGLSLAGLIRLCFGANANTGGSNRNKVLQAIEAVKSYAMAN